MVNIRRNYIKPSRQLIDEFLKQDTATVHEAMGQKGAMHSSIKPLNSGMKACGPALTVKSRAGDNLMILKALDIAQQGDILVVDAGEGTENGPWGEMTTIQALIKGLAGLVISGSIRDSLAIKEHGFPVFCKGISIMGTAKDALGLINHPICCGNVIVNPGDIILADEDGVVVIPLSEAENILKKCKERVEKEKGLVERMHSGETLFSLAGYQEVLDVKGCSEE